MVTVRVRSRWVGGRVRVRISVRAAVLFELESWCVCIANAARSLIRRMATVTRGRVAQTRVTVYIEDDGQCQD